MNKLEKLKRRLSARNESTPGLGEDGIFDVTSTPITNYKNRRKLIAQSRLLQRPADDEELTPSRNRFKKSLRNSGIGQKLSTGLNKLKPSTTESENDDNESQEGETRSEGNGWINEIGFSKTEQKDLELEEQKIYKMFKIRVKRWSYFVLLFSAYVLLNVCIGFSSAPFYQHNIECYLYDPTEVCDSL